MRLTTLLLVLSALVIPQQAQATLLFTFTPGPTAGQTNVSLSGSSVAIEDSFQVGDNVGGQFMDSGGFIDDSFPFGALAVTGSISGVLPAALFFLEDEPAPNGDRLTLRFDPALDNVNVFVAGETLTGEGSTTIPVDFSLFVPGSVSSVSPLGAPFDVIVVPEPTSLVLLAMGGLTLLRRRRR